jgi:hypothetical protein
MSEVVVVGAFTAREGKESEAEDADITVYDAIPGGRDRKGSLAAHAGG